MTTNSTNSDWSAEQADELEEGLNALTEAQIDTARENREDIEDTEDVSQFQEAAEETLLQGWRKGQPPPWFRNWRKVKRGNGALYRKLWKGIIWSLFVRISSRKVISQTLKSLTSPKAIGTVSAYA